VGVGRTEQIGEAGCRGLEEKLLGAWEKALLRSLDRPWVPQARRRSIGERADGWSALRGYRLREVAEKPVACVAEVLQAAKAAGREMTKTCQKERGAPCGAAWVAGREGLEAARDTPMGA